MTRERRRLFVLLAAGACLFAAAGLTLAALSDNIVFFLAPSELASKAPAPGRSFRVSGMVAPGTVSCVGILPDLFREGQGVVALGTLRPDGSFAASEVLAKHDETYMPKEVAEALRKSGHWNPNAGPPPPAATWNTLRPATSGG